MAEKIEFQKHTQKSVLHNPMMDGALDTQTIEIRRDPLTGAMSMFSDRLQDKINVFFGESDYNLIKKLAAASEANCFLCGEKWKKITHEWWANRRSKFDIYISQLVIQEAAYGDKEAAKKRLEILNDIPLLELTTEAVDLARIFVKKGPIPAKAIEEKMHYILLWPLSMAWIIYFHGIVLILQMPR